MSYTPKTDVNGLCCERVPCRCGQGYASYYDGCCGNCRKRKNQRKFEYLRLSNKEPTKNHKCQICEHRNDCTLKEECGL